jgi:hypothetical protein
MKTITIMGVAMAITAAAFAVAAPAQAATGYRFLSPDGNIACSMSQAADGDGHVVCDISSDNGFNAQLPMECSSGRLVSFILDQGQPAGLQCHSGKVDRSPNVLSYGETRNVGLIDCVNLPADTECSDRASQHYFRIFTDHYEMY